MPKYYVKSGQMKFVVDTSDDTSAILATLKHYKGKGIMSGPKICVSEKGFETFKEWKCYDIEDFLKEI